LVCTTLRGKNKMKNLMTLVFGLILMITTAEARTAYQVYRMPAAGNIPGYGAIDLSQSAARTGILPNANTTATSANTNSAIVARDGSGNFSAGTITAALTGNASTASALAANPVDCNPGDFAIAIAANGDLTCATPSGSQAGIQFREEGVALGAAGTVDEIDCVGSSLTCSRSTNKITITVAGGGDVTGPAASVDSEIALFNSTTGKIIKRATQTGIASLASGVLSGVTTSAGISSALSDETGSGALVFGTSPTLVTPALGTPSALVGTNITGTASALNIGGNAATATALAANPTDCGASQFAISIDASGNLTCAAAGGSSGVTAVAASSIDWSLTPVYTKTLSANTTFTFTGAVAGQTIIVRLTNTASNYTVTWPTVKWAGGAAPVMTVGAKDDVYTFIYDGSTYYGSYIQDMF
jgi:hypothetical protein